MELVPGETLADRIKRDGAIPVVEAITIAKQMAEALEAAHEKGIVHRDLKPANVKVTPDGKVKVLDFGLAKAFSDDGSSQDIANSPTMSGAATMQGLILGTAAYMSPEQARGNQVDRRADIWAFGVVLYEMLMAEQLFAGETVTDTLAHVITREPDWDRVPARTQPLLRWCLQKDPKKRLRDITDGITTLEASPEEKAGQLNAKSAPKWLWAIAIAGCLAAISLAVIHFREKPPVPPQAVRYHRLPDKVTFTAGGTFTFPGRRHAAFPAVGPGSGAAVWVQDLDALEAHELPDTSTGPEPPPFFWSPDSRYIVFSNNGPKLRKADLQGGPTLDICDKPGPPIGGSWNRDGVIIFGSNREGLWRVSAAGGTPVHLTALEASRQEREHELPQFLPDGKHFIYLRFSKLTEMTGIYVGSLDDPPERENKKLILATGFGAIYVPSIDSTVGRLVFLKEGSLMAQTFDPEKLELLGQPLPVVDGVKSVYETGWLLSFPGALIYRTTSFANSYQMMWVDDQGKTGETVGPSGDIDWPTLSPDGTRVAYVKAASDGSGTSDIWLLDLARGANSRLTFGGSANSYPRWSPDGREIVFASNREGRFNMYRKPADGSREEELLLRATDNAHPESWSRDGKYLIYLTSKNSFNSNSLWVLPMQADRTPFPVARTQFDERTAEFSPDGRWIAYSSNESGVYELYVREFVAPPGATEAGAKWLVSNGSGAFPEWRADGKELTYHNLLKGNRMSVSIDPGREFHAGVPRELFQEPAGSVRATATADLKRYLELVPAKQEGPQSFTVVVNWAAGLKR